MTPDERQLLETTARSLLKLQDDVTDRVGGIELVLKALFLANGDTVLALARLRVAADLLVLKGKPSRYLAAFLEQTR